MHTASSGNPSIGEVLAELAVDEVGPPQLLLPIAIRLDLVDEDGALLTPVSGQVALSVSVQIEAARPGSGPHRLFQIPVCTVRPFHSMSRGSPTFTDTSRAVRGPGLMTVSGGFEQSAG